MHNYIANISNQFSIGFSIFLYANDFDFHLGDPDLLNSFIQLIIKESKRELGNSVQYKPCRLRPNKWEYMHI